MNATKKVVQPIEERLGRKEPVDYPSSVSDKGDFVVEDWQRREAATSIYDLDRIILNVWHQYRGGIPPSDPAGAVRREAERLRATGLDNHKELTLIPLCYAARAVKIQKNENGLQLGDDAVTHVKTALNLVENLATKFGMDDDRATRIALADLLPSATLHRHAGDALRGHHDPVS